MNQKKHSLAHFAMTYGLYMGLALVVYSLILYVASLSFNTSLNSLVYLIIAVGIYLSLKNYRDKQNGGILTFGTGFKLGILVAVFAGFISGVFSYVLNLLDPSLMEQMLEVQQQALLEKGIPEDQVAQMEDMMRTMTNPLILVISSIFSMALIGVIFSAIIAAIVKKKPTDPFASAVSEVE